ncbi:hypothetical protein [Sinomicrobium sp. M5D2P17]
MYHNRIFRTQTACPVDEVKIVRELFFRTIAGIKTGIQRAYLQFRFLQILSFRKNRPR